ncbi:OmpA family protein [Reinekea marina]|uniref:OmpA family protein n=1 Tax=Reinekea marina TaxID=1310421 RepID=A0ABV7WNP4_9GAMM|nr:OmpA family protein [Reinekea marina]MDN3649859.1 OmpA family protein [Reinekea marina]
MKPIERGSVGNIEDYTRQQDEVDRLRSLVLGDEYQEALESLLSKESDEDRVANVVSEAIKKRSKQDDSVTRSLAPIVDSALKTSIDENPNRIINVIFPILGPAVRRAVSVALADMFQSLNSILEQSLNIKSFWWRFKANRAGIPYAQYVLLNSLKFRVEQVLLVHRETGLLLNHVAQPEIQTQDPELVSSMLTAILDFITDSFEQDRSGTLEGIRFGEFQLHISAGPDVIIAAAVRGIVSEQVRITLDEASEQIQAGFAQEIETFNGDLDPFSETHTILKACLLSQALEVEKKPKIPFAAIVVLLITVGLIVNSVYTQYIYSQEYQRIITILKLEPGYALVSHERAGDLITGSLLRDPMSRLVSSVSKDISSDLMQLSLDEQIVYFQLPENAGSVESVDVSESIQTLLSNFDQVKAFEQNGELRLSGIISQESLKKIMSSAEFNDFYNRVDFSDVTILQAENLAKASITQSDQYQQLIQEVGSVSFYFLPSSLALTQESQVELLRLVKNLKQLNSLHTDYGFPAFELLIVGFADSQGSVDANQRISQLRASHVKDMLVENGVDSTLIVSWGFGHVDGSELSADSQRRVSVSLYSELESDVVKGIQ